jgi:hypothetical protein
MTTLTQAQFQRIGNTIRSVVSAESDRYFKSEVNTEQRSKYVARQIYAAVRLALLDANVPMDTIDPTEIIRERMVEDGYIVSDA